jgi:hypothetical protein
MSYSDTKFKGPWGWNLADIAVKLLIPLAVAYFAWVQNDIAIRNQSTQQDRSVELKLVEIAWTSLTSEDQTEKSSALNLVRTLRPELAAKLASSVSQDEKQPPEIRREASQFTADISASSLEDYKIDIYYQADVAVAARTAKNVQTIILSRKLTKRIVLAPRDDAFFADVGIPDGNEVRYLPGIEDEPAQALAAILNSTDISMNFRLRPVHTRTPGTLSVFIYTEWMIDQQHYGH